MDAFDNYFEEVANEATDAKPVKQKKVDNLTPEERELMDQLNAKHKSNLQRSYIMKNYCVDKIEKHYKANEHKLFKYISKYRDRNFDVLSSPYVTKIMIFNTQDSNIVFDCCGVDEKELQSVMNTVEDLPINTDKSMQEKVGKKVSQKNITPFRVLTFFLFRYYYMKNDIAKAEEILFYYACSQYPTIFSSQFRIGVKRPEAMVYAVDHMDNRFALKKEGSLGAAIVAPLKKAGLDSYTHFVEDASDWWVQYIIGQFKTREMGMMKSVQDAYKKAYDSGNITVAQGRLVNDDGEVIERDTSMTKIDTMANKYTTYFYSNPIDVKLATNVANINKVAVSEIRNVLETMQQDRNIDELFKFYTSLFAAYYDMSTGVVEEGIHSANFIKTAQAIYKKGNSNDKNVKTIKAIAHKWCERGSVTYRASNNAGTLNNFRSSIYYYFVFNAAQNK